MSDPHNPNPDIPTTNTSPDTVPPPSIPNVEQTQPMKVEQFTKQYAGKTAEEWLETAWANKIGILIVGLVIFLILK